MKTNEHEIAVPDTPTYEVTIVIQTENVFVVKATTATRAVNSAMRNQFDDVADARIVCKNLIRVEEKTNA